MNKYIFYLCNGDWHLTDVLVKDLQIRTTLLFNKPAVYSQLTRTYNDDVGDECLTKSCLVGTCTVVLRSDYFQWLTRKSVRQLKRVSEILLLCFHFNGIKSEGLNKLSRRHGDESFAPHFVWPSAGSQNMFNYSISERIETNPATLPLPCLATS